MLSVNLHCTKHIMAKMFLENLRGLVTASQFERLKFSDRTNSNVKFEAVMY